MEEKKIIKSLYNSKIIPIITVFVGVILLFATYMVYLDEANRINSEWGFFDVWSIGELVIIIVLPVVFVYLLLKIILSSTEIIVTDKRVYGKTLFGKRVDLPFDSISAVGTTRIIKGIAVATSAGKIKFLGVENIDDIHNAISKILMERQDKTKTTMVIKETSNSVADDLKKFKELLDSGVITQEEYDKKKKQLLGL